MSGTTRSSANLAPRRKRLIFQAWHRGTREMDLLMGMFTDEHIDTFTDAELTEFETLLNVPDTVLYRWITEQDEVPDNHRCAILDKIISFHKSRVP
ncbi:succinate dehydrogenase assembly factor 2 [Acuticoccus sp. MNP-M23]|uniref:FAD assembly factor SdhE n=1 Tax=Acuticoccus sp. MNP-M23 TaxID=3072793 RepID=UPI002814F934|nr:succinate dehydrogenase assembly factor 2 [Acuticoccus sp. MNP-M23]WMS42168.1 succinate dehydrogenase assembly factor 2 [Acuticoccus sp. MNP-M23]